MKRHGSLKTKQCNELTPMCGSDYTDPSQLQKVLGNKATNEQSNYHGEFDPGSGRTLAACLTHASRAMKFLRERISGGRVSNTWATCLIEGNSLPKGRLIPHKIVASHEVAIKGAIRYKMGPRRIS